MNKIESLLKKLKNIESNDLFFNHYKSESILNNLRVYLNTLLNTSHKKSVLLVGEAPGHKGCKITGIPFTSSKLFTTSPHPFLNRIKKELLFSHSESEATATIVWNYLNSKHVIIPIFWNAFPFHPHIKNKSCSNRSPTPEELILGEAFIKEIHDIYQPEIIAAIGRKAELSLKNLFSGEAINYIRHPSHGGKQEFIQCMDNILTDKN